MTDSFEWQKVQLQTLRDDLCDPNILIDPVDQLRSFGVSFPPVDLRQREQARCELCAKWDRGILRRGRFHPREGGVLGVCSALAVRRHMPSVEWCADFSDRTTNQEDTR